MVYGAIVVIVVLFISAFFEGKQVEKLKKELEIERKARWAAVRQCETKKKSLESDKVTSLTLELTRHKMEVDRLNRILERLKGKFWDLGNIKPTMVPLTIIDELMSEARKKDRSISTFETLLREWLDISNDTFLKVEAKK